jgi:GNAT superfamily N-acetyltransferase
MAQLLEMATLVIHPAYWSRGHATALIEWGIALANLDGARQAVVALPMSARLFRKLGFVDLDEVLIRDPEDDVEGGTGGEGGGEFVAESNDGSKGFSVAILAYMPKSTGT